MDYIDKVIVHALINRTIDGQIHWEDATSYEYESLMDALSINRDFVSYVWGKQLGEDKYYVILSPVYTDLKEEEITSMVISKENEFLYQTYLRGEDGEKLFFWAKFSKEPFGKLFRYLSSGVTIGS